MKAVILLSILLSGAISFAGPEDHINDQVCYSIATADSPKAHSELPTELCFEKVTVIIAPAQSEQKDVIEVYSYFSHYSQYLQNLKLTKFIRSTEDEYSYQAESVLVDRTEQHCEDAVKIVLHLEGKVDFLGIGDISAQNVALTQVTKADVCHSNFERHVFKYVRTN